LAVHWAHRVAHRFPDGQLHLNLRGFDAQAPATDPAEAIRAVLGALEVPSHRIPVGTAELVGLYRSRMAGRRILILLDNARDTEQVRPLLPGAPGCLVLVTSRDQMTGLVAAEAARSITLDLMTTSEAWELLDQRLGTGRLAAEAPAVEEIVHRCARLPIALSIVSARAATRPRVALASLAHQLRSAQDRLDAFDGGDPTTDVRAVLLCSYQTLSGQSARLFRLLSLAPGHDISAPAAASLAGLALARTRRLLAELTRSHLVAEHVAGRFTFHDLLRAYSAELAHTHDAGPDQREARLRILDYYLHAGWAAGQLLEPQRDMVTPMPARPGVVSERHTDAAAALAWFAAEWHALVSAIQAAAEHDHARHCWQLAWVLASFCQRVGHWHELIATSTNALEVTRRQGDELGGAYAHRGLARAHFRLGQHGEARDHLRQALRLYRGLNHTIGLANVHYGLTSLAVAGGEHRLALYHGQRSLALFRAAGDRGGEAEALGVLAWSQANCGRYDAALAHGQQALFLYKEIGDSQGEASTWDTMGYAQHHLGHKARAMASFERALRLYEEGGERYLQTETLTHLGDTQLAAGDLDAARRSWQRALDILADLDHPDTAEVRMRLTVHQHRSVSSRG
jgi:tetratricopeptide (TPR) repeat protein